MEVIDVMTEELDKLTRENKVLESTADEENIKLLKEYNELKKENKYLKEVINLKK
jgi:hypothetical protein